MKSLRWILTDPRYFAPAWVFASINILFGTWAIYIPEVKDKLGIDKSQLGVALFCLSLGVFTVFPFAAKIINRIGVGKATWIGIISATAAAMLPLLAPDYHLLMVALFLFGATTGFTDISMNTLVTEIEKEDHRRIMSAAHGFFSLGGIVAGLGSFAIVPLSNPILHMGLAMALVFLVNLATYRNYVNITAPPMEAGALHLDLFKPLMLLAVVSFVVMGSEGAIVDWSGLYLKEIVQAPEALWGAGFLGFQCAMTFGRFFGDGLSTRLGSIKMLALGISVAILGYILVLEADILVAIAGFSLCGLGFSVVIPELFRIVGQVKGIPAAHGISFIAGMGYIGFMGAPPLLGYVAKQGSLTMSFVVLLGAALVVLASTVIMGRRRK